MSEHASATQLRRLLVAVMSVGSDLALPAVLRRITEAARDLVQARYAALGVLDESGTGLSEFITVGLGDAQRKEIGELPKGHGILGLLITDPRPLRLVDLNAHPESFGFPPHHPPMRSFLGVPLHVRGEVFGNLYLTDKEGEAGFNDVDEELALSLASAAAIAIENARLHERSRELLLLADRERIARDLHDTVVQRLFATGLAMQGTARLAARPDVVDRLQQHIEDLDETIRQVRTAVFQLEARRVAAQSLRRELLDIAAQAGRALGFDPVVRLEGPIDSAVPDDVANAAIAVASEALSNVARHAGASHVELEVRAGRELVVEITDNGQGLPRSPARGGSGLRNLAARAAACEGELLVERRRPLGTRLRFVAPLDRPGFT